MSDFWTKDRKTIQEQMRNPTFTDGEILFYNTNNDYCWLSAGNQNLVVKVAVVGDNRQNFQSCKIKVIETYSDKFPVDKEMTVIKNFLLTEENFQLWMQEILP